MKPIRKMTRIARFGLASLLGLLSSCGKEDSELTNANQIKIITTVVITLSPEDESEDVVLRFEDLDGNGPAPAQITNATLQDSLCYRVSVLFRNATTDPVTDVTGKIRTEAEEYQVFYQFEPDLNVTLAYTDSDRNGNPLGLASRLCTLAEGSVEFTLTLRHQPDKNGLDVSDGDLSNAGGETGIKATFDLTVQ